jgi:hypothetical protein
MFIVCENNFLFLPKYTISHVGVSDSLYVPKASKEPSK